jgi:hypothetical protein
MTPVLVADTFFSALARLDGPDRLRAIEFLTDFRQHPANPGLSLERVQGARSPDVWGARINQRLRVILHKDGDCWAVLHVDQHDAAYDWACRRRIGRHSATGSLQIVEAVEMVEEVRRVIDVPVVPPEPRRFEPHGDGYLLSLGVPESWLPTVREVRTDEQLLTVCDRLPPEVAERLLDLADGRLVTPPTPVPAERPAAESRDTRQRFLAADDSFDLEALLGAPLDRWIAFLHPSQRALVEGDFRGPVKVSGPAGTGKTVVALHRSRHLARQGKRVLLTSFVTTLCRNLENNLRRICTPAELEQITVSTVHKVALDTVRAAEPRARPAPQRDVNELLDSLLRRFPTGFEPEFLRAEWDNVIERQGLADWPGYRRAIRSGRGRPLSVRERQSLWQVFGAVLEDLARRHLYTFPFLCRRAERALREGEAESPFDAVVVDEVQDLQPAELRFVRELAAGAPGALMLVGDAGQRIYAGGFSLSALGIETRGRSRVLRLNYRTTEEIRSVADRLLGADCDDLDGGLEERSSRSLLRGLQPTLRGFPSEEAETAHVVERVRRWLAAGLRPEEIAVFARTAKLVERAGKALAVAGIGARGLRDHQGAGWPGVHVGTMHRAKGLEFKAVLAISCSRGVIPSPQALSSCGDPVDRDEAAARERRLLYVVMTRARDELEVTWVGQPSPLLAAALDGSRTP